MAKLKFNPAAYQDLGAYALLKNVVENGHLVTDGGTLPASVEAVTESRELKPSDINKVLYVPLSVLDVYLSFPTKNFFKDGDIIGFATQSPSSNIQLRPSGPKLFSKTAVIPTGDGGAEVVILRYTEGFGLVPLTGSIDVGSNESKTPVRYLLDNITPPSYKTYAAILTQGGGSDPQKIDTGVLEIGVTYLINANSPGMDFTNVGALNNTVGTYFVATGTTPNSWGSNEGMGNNTLVFNEGAPIVIEVLENTIGDIYWTYQTTGLYRGNLTGAFPVSKTITRTEFVKVNEGVMSYATVTRIDDNTIGLVTQDSNLVPADGILSTPTFIEIRVYN